MSVKTRSASKSSVRYKEANQKRSWAGNSTKPSFNSKQRNSSWGRWSIDLDKYECLEANENICYASRRNSKEYQQQYLQEAVWAPYTGCTMPTSIDTKSGHDFTSYGTAEMMTYLTELLPIYSTFSPVKCSVRKRLINELQFSNSIKLLEIHYEFS